MLDSRDWTDLPVYSASALKRDLGPNARIPNDFEDEISLSFDSSENDQSDIIDYSEDNAVVGDVENVLEAIELLDDIQDRDYATEIFENVTEEMYEHSVKNIIEDNSHVEAEVEFSDDVSSPYHSLSDVEDFISEVEVEVENVEVEIEIDFSELMSDVDKWLLDN